MMLACRLLRTLYKIARSRLSLGCPESSKYHISLQAKRMVGNEYRGEVYENSTYLFEYACNRSHLAVVAR